MATAAENQTRTEKALMTTISRGATLWFDGYRAEPYPEQPGLYAVYQPEGKRLQKGQAAWYDVDVCNGTCQCGAFQQHGRCKHLIALLAKLSEAINFLGNLLPVTVMSTVLNETGAFPDSQPGNVATATNRDWTRKNREADFS